MSEKKSASIVEHFSVIKDPRIERQKLHKLCDIIVIAICAVTSSADSWEEIEEFGIIKYDWLKTFLELPNGIPSHDTFNRVFSLINMQEFQLCFLGWVRAVFEITQGQVVAIDGKTARRSHDKYSGKSAIHLVNAWASGNRVVLGQVKTDTKSNEITAIPELLKILELKGCIVTIDAMGCQKDIATAIADKGADYVLAVKENQKSLYEDIEFFFTAEQKNNFKDVKMDYYETIEKGHGRIETRRYWTTAEIDWLKEPGLWKNLNIIGMVESERQTGEKISIEKRYFISSLKNDAKIFGKAVRERWGVENGLHWVLDIAFREDESRKRAGYAAENFALLRLIALNLLRQERGTKLGVKGKRLKAGWDNNYLLKVLGIAKN